MYNLIYFIRVVLFCLHVLILRCMTYFFNLNVAVTLYGCV